MRALLPLLLAALWACRAPAPEKAFEPPAGRRGFTLAVDKSQTRFLAPGDEVELSLLIEAHRADGTPETRAEAISAKAAVLRVRPDWGEGTGLVQLALSPEEAQEAALAVEREDRLFLNKLPGKASLAPAAPASPAELAAGHRGLAVLVYADQEAFAAPGSRVDVIAVRRPARASSRAEPIALTLAQDVPVLGAEPAAEGEEWAAVQLMLTPAQLKAMTRAVAGEDQLSLASRAAADRGARPIEPSRLSRRFPAERAGPKS